MGNGRFTEFTFDEAVELAQRNMIDGVPSTSRVLLAKIAELQSDSDELAVCREKNRELHRRCQRAEAALPDYRKIIAMPPDGDGVRFVQGTLGRALLTALCDRQSHELAELRARIEAAPVFGMHLRIDSEGKCYGATFGTNSDPGQRVRLLPCEEIEK